MTIEEQLKKLNIKEKVVFGVIDEGKLKGKKIIIKPREDLKQNEFLVEKAMTPLGVPAFHKACLVCEEYIPDYGCPNEGREDHV